MSGSSGAPAVMALVPSTAWFEAANRHALTARLVAATVHDASNALQVVSGAAEMLGLDDSPASVAKRAPSIVQQAMAATATLQELAGFTRDTGRPSAPVPVREVCRRALQMRQYTLRKLRIATTLDGDEGPCTMPARDLLQVVLNLVVNAEQALADQASPTLTLHVTSDTAEVTLRVADNGPGVPDEARSMAVPWPPREPGDGARLGLGLYVSRLQVERAGGTLAIEEGDGASGAVVVVRLRR